MDTQTQVERLIELAIIQRAELKRLVEELPQLREHLNAEVERTFEDTEPQLRAELEEFVAKQAEDKTSALGVALEARISQLAKTLQDSAQAKFSAIMAAREQNAELLKIAEGKIAEAAAALPSSVKEIVTAELARFPRAGEIDKLRKEFAEPRGLNPRGKWTSGETYNRLDLVSFNGDSFVSSVDGNSEKPNRNGGSWTLSAARGAYGGGGGITSLIDLYNKPSAGQVLIGNGRDYVNANITAGDGIAITNGAGSITIAASGGVNYQGTWDASTNTPNLTSGVGTKGYYYVVSVAGSTNLDGITDWKVGDWAIYNGTAWQKVDNTDQVSSVFGRTGAVTAVSTDYSAVGITNTAIGASNPSTGAFTTITTTGTITSSNSVHAANGSAANPSLAFVNSQNTGLYRYGAGAIGIAANGTSVGNWDSTALTVSNNLGVSGTLTAPDLTLGTNGPSVKSSLDARAARQGLVFDGTNVTTGVAAGALGTGDFTISWWQNVQNNANGYGTLFGGGSGPVIQNFDGSGRLQIIRGDGIGGSLSSSSAVVTGKWEFWTIVRSSGTATWYKNGVADGSGSLGSDFTGNSYVWGRGGSYVIQGSVSGCLIYNRALSASEVTSLFEAGVPAGADYNTASNTALNVATFIQNPTYPYTTFSGASATGFTATSNGAGFNTAYCPTQFTVRKGSKYRITYTLTLTSGTAPTVVLGISGVTDYSNSFVASAGTNSFEFTATTSATDARLVFYNSSTATSFAVSNISLVPVGLLLAPDAYQAGGGLAWYDTSGNAASITLPASGVSWNVPSSQKTASGWTFGGNLNVRSALGYATGVQSGTTSDSTQQFILSSSGAYNHAYIGKNGTNLGIGFSSTNGSFTEDNAITIAAATKAVTLAGNLTVSGTGNFTGQINASSGYQFRGANNTAYELMRYVGGTNNPGLFVTVTESTKKVLLTASGSVVGGQTIGIGAEGSEALTIGSANATLAGNLTVSGTGTNTFSGPLSVTSSVGVGSQVAATFISPNTLGSFLVLNKTSGTARNWYIGATGTGSSAGDGNLAFYDNEASAFRLVLNTSGNLLLGTTTDSGQKLQVSGTASISGAISIGNTVTSAASVASTHKVTISIGGVTYYLLASNV